MTLPLAGRSFADDNTWRFDFGNAEAAEGYLPVHRELYSSERGYGWLPPAAVNIDRQNGPNALLRDFAWSAEPAVFRVDLPDGIYRVRVTCGDLHVGNHGSAISTTPAAVMFPEVHPVAGEYVTLSAAFPVREGLLEIRLESRGANWLVNALTVERVTEEQAVEVQRERHGPAPRSANPTARVGWPDLAGWGNPVEEPLERFRQARRQNSSVEPTGLTAADYLRLMAGNVDFFKNHQDANGAILDPYEEQEMQYSTPAFALAAATLIRHAGREDLREAAGLAMDWATRSLREGQAPQQHEHFFPHLLAHALRHFEAIGTDRDGLDQWRENLREFDAFKVYRGIGGGNWNVVALTGQAMLYLQGVREDLDFVERSLAVQGRYFTEWGLYVDGAHEAMAYDLFPRLWLNDLLAHGWEGAYAKELRELLWRGAVTSLLIQSPAGELPTGMRSAHHQWNEAQQCATFEIYALEAARRGDEQLAGAFKRAARLSLGSMQRWVRPSGELWIVKNRVDPARRHGYEGYSFHSQYNLLAMGMLAIAHEHARQSGEIAEEPAPADVGGFVVDLREFFHKVIANAGGHYALIDTAGYNGFNPTGLLRVHHRRGNPQLGPTEGLIARQSDAAAAVGLAWQTESGEWRSLAEYDRDVMRPVELKVEREQPDRVEFELIYRADFAGADHVVEHYLVTPQQVRLRTHARGNDGTLQIRWPLLVDDGEREPEIELREDGLRLRLEGAAQNFTTPGASSVFIEEKVRPFRNGWARIAVAEFPAGTTAEICIETDW